MMFSWRNWALVTTLFLILPGIGLLGFLQGLRQEREAGARQESWRSMEEVLHRTNRRGQAPLFARQVLSRSVRFLSRGVPPARALGATLRAIRRVCDFTLFDTAGNPVPAGRPLVLSGAWRRLLAGVRRCHRERSPSTSSEEKLATQLLGDRSAVRILSQSVGHFKQFGIPLRYSYGGWWQIAPDRTGVPRFHLLAFLKTGAFPRQILLRQAVRQAARRCRAFFSVGLVGRPEGRSFRRLPPDVQRAIQALPGGQGPFLTSSHQGFALSATADLTMVAWHARHRELPAIGWLPTPETARIGFFGILAVGGLGLIRLLVFGDLRRVSFRYLVPVMIFLAVVPPLAFQLLTVREQRQKVREKEIFEVHRGIEAQLQQIDIGYAYLLEEKARFQTKLLVEFSERQDWTSWRQLEGMNTLLSAYVFDEKSQIIRNLRSPVVNPANDRRTAEGLVKKLLDTVWGRIGATDLEDPYFPYFLKNLGRFVEMRLLDDRLAQFVDMQPLAANGNRLFGIFLTHDRDRLMREYLRQVLHRKNRLPGSLFALVSWDEGNLLRALPPAFLGNPDGVRLAEQTLESARTTDAMISLPGNRPFMVTAIPGKNLKGFLLIGARSMDDILTRDRVLQRWTLLVSAAALALGLLSAGFLLNWLSLRFRSLQKGVEGLQAHHYELQVGISGSDEFGELARGLESAASTIEEIYSSLPLQEALVQWEPLPPGRFALAGGFEPGSEPGGDYVDAFPLSDGRHLLVLGDALGEGWKTALVVGGLRAAVRLLAQRPMTDLPSFVREVNRHYLGFRGTIRFTTLLVGILDLEQSTIDLFSAGHCQPVLLRAGSATWLSLPGTPLGTGRTGQGAAFRLTLDTGDALILATDGWLKTRNPAGDHLGPEGFRQMVESAADDSLTLLDRLRSRTVAAGFTDTRLDDRSVFVLTCVAGRPTP